MLMAKNKIILKVNIKEKKQTAKHQSKTLEIGFASLLRFKVISQLNFDYAHFTSLSFNTRFPSHSIHKYKTAFFIIIIFFKWVFF